MWAGAWFTVLQHQNMHQKSIQEAYKIDARKQHATSSQNYTKKKRTWEPQSVKNQKMSKTNIEEVYPGQLEKRTSEQSPPGYLIFDSYLQGIIMVTFRDVWRPYCSSEAFLHRFWHRIWLPFGIISLLFACLFQASILYRVWIDILLITRCPEPCFLL